jgi:hypothetical protein
MRALMGKAQFQETGEAFVRGHNNPLFRSTGAHRELTILIMRRPKQGGERYAAGGYPQQGRRP